MNAETVVFQTDTPPEAGATPTNPATGTQTASNEERTGGYNCDNGLDLNPNLPANDPYDRGAEQIEAIRKHRAP